MSATEKIDTLPSKIGILAGGGEIPRLLVQACKKQNIDVFVVGFEGQTDSETLTDTHHMIDTIGGAGRIMKRLGEEGISDIVLIGRIRRPSLKELKPDMKTAEFFTRDAISAFGDDGMLKALRGFLERHGFKLHPVQHFMPDIVAPFGVLTKIEPSAKQQSDVKRGAEVLTVLSPYDVGQAVIVQNGHVLGIEGAEGTDELIRRCAGLQRKGGGAVLVKMCKRGQDQALDLPTIGADTIKLAQEAGYAGIAVHAGQSLIVDVEAVQTHANQAKLFMVGIDI